MLMEEIANDSVEWTEEKPAGEISDVKSLVFKQPYDEIDTTQSCLQSAS